MPLIKIELARGKEKSILLELMDAVMASVRETLKIPGDDTNIRLIEHDPAFFIMKRPYAILIEITLFSGRTAETKKNLFRSIVDSLQSKLAIDKDAVFIVLNEQPRENWGIRGGIPASEIGLGFKVDI
jgi:4-oxalocrotonate tautomerase family enzyme